jgi:hypothetical protein
MFTRLVATFLALVLCWSRLSAQEHSPMASAGADGTVMLAQALSPYAGSDGSVDDHHLDDRPVQPHAESQADLPGLLPGGPALHAPELLMARPSPFAATMLRSPYLDGPQRPPCTPHSAA